MNAALQTVDSASEQVAGLSDEREAQLWAMANGEGPGLGEAFATLEDAQELGL